MRCQLNTHLSRGWAPDPITAATIGRLVPDTARGKPPRSSPTPRDALTTTLALGASVALFSWMARWLFTGRVPLTGDLLHLHYPVRHFYATALASHQRVDWMPSFFAGFYVVGEGQLAAYHPLHWLLYGFLPLQQAFAIEVLAAYPGAFAGMWLWLRHICPTPAAVFGAMLFTFCGFNLAHGVHPNMVSILAHLPWLLWAMHGAFLAESRRRRAGWCAAIGLLTGSQFLLGHPQAVWFSGLVEAAYALLLLASFPRQQAVAGALTVACGGLLGLAIGATQVTATLYTVTRSVRSTFDASFSTQFSLPLQHLVQLVQPYALWGRVLRWNEAPGAGDELAVYGGRSRSRWWPGGSRTQLGGGRTRTAALPERLGVWAVLLGLLGLWLATGEQGRLYLAQTWLPIVQTVPRPGPLRALRAPGLCLRRGAGAGRALARRIRGCGGAPPGPLGAVDGDVALCRLHGGARPADGQDPHARSGVGCRLAGTGAFRLWRLARHACRAFGAVGGAGPGALRRR